MKQGDKFLKITMILIAAAVFSYFGYALYGYFSSPLSTVTALEYEADAGAVVTGYVVRDEQLLTASQPIVIPALSEGERVGAGQTVAVAYHSEDAFQRQAEIQNLQQQIRQLTYATDATLSPLNLGAQIDGLLVRYAVQTAGGSTDPDLSDRLKGLLVRSDTGDDALASLEAERNALEAELSRLTAEESGGTALSAGAAGYFSGAADGYESVLTPEALETMDLAAYQALPGAAEPVDPQAYGRLILSDRWYFVTALPTEQLGEAAVGDTVRLTFAQNPQEEMALQIQRIVSGDGETSLLVLSGDSHLPSVTLLRRQACTLIFETYSGLRVPKEALHVDEEGNTGVYILEGAVARWKPVEILYASSDDYVAALDQSSTDTLWPGDEILLGSNLYDGKVVYQ